MYLLHFLRWMAGNHDQPFAVVSLTGGDLRADFEALGPVVVLDERSPDTSVLADPGLIYVNTAISARAIDHLPSSSAPQVAHIHELEVGLSFHIDAADWARLRRPGTRWVAASNAVATNLARHHGMALEEITVHHEMVDTHVAPARAPAADLRAAVGIPAEARVVGTAAAVSWRKGPDLFVQLAVELGRRHEGDAPHLVWIGADPGDPATVRFRDDVRAAGLDHRVHVLDAVEDPTDWLRAFDVFVLPAREDAFPLACLEAAAVGCPIVCFDTGGMPEFVEVDAGIVVPYPNTDGLARAVGELADHPARARRMGEAARRKVRRRHDVQVAAPRLHADLARWAS